MIQRMEQLTLFKEIEAFPPPADKAGAGTFAGNRNLPVHRWFRYSAGFNAAWVEEEIKSFQKRRRKKPNIIDPFAGSGTVLIEADKAGCQSLGVESHPFISRVANAKLLWRSDIDSFNDLAQAILKKSKAIKGQTSSYPELIKKCFPEETLRKLDCLKQSFLSCSASAAAGKLVWLAVTSILRSCSPVGTAQCQYILPKKRKAGCEDPYTAFSNCVSKFKEDMAFIQKLNIKPRARLIADDMRQISTLPKAWGDLAITSPPYANNYDYADAVRLELSFWGEVRSWKDLQTVIRPFLVRSCTQHITNLDTYDILDNPLLHPIKNELLKACKTLDLIREEKGGKKPYHTMAAAYFLDLARVWRRLRKAMKSDSTICVVIGDSAPYGVYLPVDKWLGELALAAGFKECQFEKTRDRNIKWKNRKHNVPLKEGLLRIKG